MWTVCQTADQILERYGMEISLSGDGILDPEGRSVTPKHLCKCLQAEQQSGLIEALERKTIHGVFYKQSQKEGMDPQGSHAWLADGRLQARTEGLLIAAQDGVVLTRAYRARVLGDSVPTLCRGLRRPLAACTGVPVEAALLLTFSLIVPATDLLCHICRLPDETPASGMTTPPGSGTSQTLAGSDSVGNLLWCGHPGGKTHTL